MTTGNKVNSASFLDVLLALKRNVMRDTNVADVVIVEEITNDSNIKCKSINDFADIIYCTKLHDINVNRHDAVLVVYTDTDFRTNLSKIKSGAKTSEISKDRYHSKNFGVIVGVIYKKEN